MSLLEFPEASQAEERWQAGPLPLRGGQGGGSNAIDLLLASFDRLCDAPDAIPRLRRFILDLAVRGKLVDQNPDDEPASKLVKRIKFEKAKLLKGKDKTYPPVDNDEAPFDCPLGWQWARIREVTSDRGQTVPSGEFTYIDVTAINKEAGVIEDAKVLGPSEAPSRARKLVQTGDLLYSCVRPYLLNVAIVESEIVPRPIASTAFAIVNGFGLILPRYLWIALRSPYMVQCVEDKMRGQAYPAINDADFAVLPLAIPPLAEQRRIVAKVDELMALCDRLEAAQAERERRRERLNAASLARLNAPATDPEAFRAHANFHLTHLPRLVLHPEEVSPLRQAVLNLAVRGRLVPQLDGDGRASDLIATIANIKAQTEKRSPLSLSEKSNSELFSLPPNWTWTTSQDLSSRISDGVHQKPNYVNFGVPFLTIKNLTEGPGISFRETKFVSEEDHREFVKRCHPERGDVLITKDGTIGVTRVIETDVPFSIFVSLALVKMPISEISPYFALCIQSDLIQAVIPKTGAGLKHLHLADLRKLPIPLPPLTEQRRIVARVDELMALCDRLESGLQTSQAENRRLLDALLHATLNGRTVGA